MKEVCDACGFEKKLLIHHDNKDFCSQNCFDCYQKKKCVICNKKIEKPYDKFNYCSLVCVMEGKRMFFAYKL